MRETWCAVVLAIALTASAQGGAAPIAPPPSALPSATAELRALRGNDTSGDPQAALQHVDEVLARAALDRRVDPVDLLYARAVRGRALSSLGRTQEALALFQQVDAGLDARRVPPSPDRAALLLHIGTELGALGKLDEAQAYTERALDLAIRLAGRESPEYAESLYGLGLIDYQRGRQPQAVPRIAEALSIARAHSLGTGENLDIPVSYGMSLAALQLNVSDAETAVVTAREAVTWAEAHLPENHRERVAATQQLGAILSEAGQYGQAIPILRAALDKRRAILPPDSPQLAMSLHALAYALDNAGMRVEAGPLYDRAVEIFEANPDKIQANGLATMIGQQARMAQWEGDPAKSLALREKALAAARRYSRSPDDQVVLTAEYNLASVLVTAGRTAEAAPLLAHAREGFIKGTSEVNKRRITATALAARIAASEGRPDQALTMLADGLAPLRTRLLDRATARRDVVAMAGEFRSAFMQLARIASRSGAQEQAFDALQMANLGDLQGVFSSLAVLQDKYGPQAREAIRSYLSLSARSRQLRKALDRALIAGNDTQTGPLSAQVAAIDMELREADAQVAALVPGYQALTAVEPARLADARTRLRPGQALLLIGSDDIGLVTQLVTRDAVISGEAAVAPRRLMSLQQRLRASVDAGLIDEDHAGFDRQAAFELYRLVFPDAVRAGLHSVRELEILAPGSLSTVPFAALVSRRPEGSDADPAALRGTHWLLRDHAVSVMISAVPLPSRAARAKAKLTFAGIGAPVLGPPGALALRSAPRIQAGDVGVDALAQLASLPDAARELRDMASRFRGTSQLLIGTQATETAVKQAPLEQARVIAFATHGLVGGALRGMVEPALVMTPPSVPTPLDDGLLTASEVAQLRLDADWVILSACDTSAGDSENAPTYSGLARAFISAGSRALLLSHWPVRDDVAGRLTLRTLEGARSGMSRAEALRRAQLEVLRDPKVPGGAHPASWAPFVLVGG
ncbi:MULTISPECIES: CHAT domain-containing tetratricopeptide repeat protein [unclassified Novosphingobium]|uniref:CHAT domain-containing tetratricopeptide repeat protein n=1 Tax=unclassified Novosphingobium TaxID=2644732 RepID=UPI00135BD2B8|nr:MULTISPECIES: CHAT domain-containing tetratricopeptide repeat protein [unclassified Novosphingobium]